MQSSVAFGIQIRPGNPDNCLSGFLAPLEHLGICMKKFALAVSVLVISAVSASAADLAPQTYTKALPIEVAPACVWCGWYVGGNVGYSQSEPTSVNSSAVVTSPGLFGELVPSIPAGPAAGLTTGIPVGSQKGIIGGGQFGYNFQSGLFVAGFEADIQGLSGRATGTSVTTAPLVGAVPPTNANATLTAANSVNWLGTVRGRIGIAAAPNFLIYGTGGLAYGGVNSSTGINQTILTIGGAGTNGTFPASGNFAETRVGWTVGAGGEWMFTGNWSAKLEYLHYDLGSANYGTTVSNFAVAGGDILPGTLLYALGQSSSTNFRGDIVRVGINYKFGGPVVAKY
jgi:outer membrane immunogenic protein